MKSKTTKTITSSLQTLRKRGVKAGTKNTLGSGGGLDSYYKSLRNTRFSSQPSIDSWTDIDFIMTSDIAYQNGLYAHSYVVNFEEALEVLNLRSTINSLLSPIVDELTTKLEIISNAVKPTEDDLKAIAILRQNGQNGVANMFAKLKKNYGNFKTGLSKILKHTKKQMNNAVENFNAMYDIDAMKMNIKEEIKKQWLSSSGASQDSTILELLNIVLEQVDTLTVEDIIAYGSAGNRLLGEKPELMQPDGKRRYDFITTNYATGTASFLTLSQILSAAAKYTQTNILTKAGRVNQSYATALNALNFWDQLTKATSVGQTNQIDFTQLNAKTFNKYFGLAFEPVEAIISHGTVVGHKQTDKITATDLTIQYDTILKQITEAEEAINLSLKTASLIYRTQDLQTAGSSVIEDNNLLEPVLRPIKYYFLNFGLLTEYQLAQNQSKKTKFQDKNLLSSTTVMSIYNDLCSSLGQFFFTNIIVGFIMKNWTDNQQALDSLPKIILNSQDRKYYLTYDLLEAVKKNINKGGTALYLHPQITGSMVSVYADMVAAKHKVVGYTRTNTKENITYSTLLDYQPLRTAYDRLSSMADNMSLFTAVDVAMLMEKQGV